MKQLDLEQIQTLLTDTYRRFRAKEINKEEAKCEADLLKAMVETVEVKKVKEQLAEVKALLITNKK
jgi:hypothetical protein